MLASEANIGCSVNNILEMLDFFEKTVNSLNFENKSLQYNIAEGCQIKFDVHNVGNTSKTSDVPKTFRKYLQNIEIEISMFTIFKI